MNRFYSNYLAQRRKDAKSKKNKIKYLCGFAAWREITLILLGISLLCGCQKQEAIHLQPGDVKIEATISPAEIMIGDSAELLVKVYAPSDSRIEDLQFPKELELQNRTFDREPVSDTHTRSERRYQLTSFALGEYPLTNDVVVVKADGTALTNQLTDVTLNVVSALENSEDQKLAGIKPPIKEKHKYGRVFAVMGIIALLALLAGIIIMWIISRRKQVENQPKVIIPAHVIALDALKVLREKGWVEAENAYEFYFELSQIWRAYLENRFHLQAPESTTEEIAGLLAKSDQLNDQNKSMLQKFLRQADMIKFARETQTSTGMQQAYNLCTEFVESTQAKPEEES